MDPHLVQIFTEQTLQTVSSRRSSKPCLEVVVAALASVGLGNLEGVVVAALTVGNSPLTHSQLGEVGQMEGLH